jgi:pyruvate/2-oxoacid:ferredoxin oxidoreductase beta subunit
VEDGRRYILNHEPRCLPVEEYLMKQGRFKHLDQEQIRQIQMDVDEEWMRLKQRAGRPLSEKRKSRPAVRP